MEKENVRVCLGKFENEIPQENYAAFKKKLENAPDDMVDEICSVKTINHIIVLIMSIFFGSLGVDRFMIGDIGLGVAKLLLGWLTFGIWPIVDIFITYKKAKEINYNRLISLL